MKLFYFFIIFNLYLLSITFSKENKIMAKNNAQSVSLPKTKPQIHRLENGLEIILLEEYHAPVASVQLWCRTGSIYEGDLQGSGVSHLVEHMLFKGTEKRKLGEISRAIQDVGGYVNAFTSYEETVYYIDLPAVEQEGINSTIDILCDIAQNASFPPEEYKKERDVVRREFDMGKDSPARVLHKLSFANIFRQSPYKDPIIGHLGVYNSLNYEQVINYYKKKYVPNNMFFVIVGAIDSKKVKQRIEKNFANSKWECFKAPHIPSESKQLGLRRIEQGFPTKLAKFSLS